MFVTIRNSGQSVGVLVRKQQRGQGFSGNTVTAALDQQVVHPDCTSAYSVHTEQYFWVGSAQQIASAGDCH